MSDTPQPNDSTRPPLEPLQVDVKEHLQQQLSQHAGQEEWRRQLLASVDELRCQAGSALPSS
jgi:hypothetical protein